MVVGGLSWARKDLRMQAGVEAQGARDPGARAFDTLFADVLEWSQPVPAFGRKGGVGRRSCHGWTGRTAIYPRSTPPASSGALLCEARCIRMAAQIADGRPFFVLLRGAPDQPPHSAPFTGACVRTDAHAKGVLRAHDPRPRATEVALMPPAASSARRRCHSRRYVQRQRHDAPQLLRPRAGCGAFGASRRSPRGAAGGEGVARASAGAGGGRRQRLGAPLQASRLAILC